MRSSSEPFCEGGENLHSQAADAADDAFGFQPRIGLADRHRIDGRVAGHLPNAGQQVALAEQSAGDQREDLIHDLPVNRHAGVGINLENDG